MYINLSGLNVLVTGASRGIGKAIAAKLAEAGATVAVHYHKSGREAENLAHVLGNESKAFQADLAQPDEVVQLFDKVVSEFGSLELLVNNAGLAIASDMGSADKQWLEEWNKTMMVNLNATAILCKKAIDHWLKRKATGRIINISSRAAFRGDTAEYLAYAASKGGVVSLTRSIARAYGKQGIKAFNIAPGFVRTDMAKEFVERYGEQVVLGDLALERLTEPKDIAPMVTFLCSGLADHATGSTIDINAGSYVH
ncbi:MAG: SDR family oxidoreductase [Imperialibacter sp.]|uniref:SDR family NAD(P)-dependent oxidoreductase n=1 Tax=Imperialibacter sp. TaxID=2038411 RepID=UPI0032ECEB5E